MGTKTKKTPDVKSKADEEFRKPSKMQPLKGKKEKKVVKKIVNDDDDDFDNDFLGDDFDDLDIANDDYDDDID